MAETVGAVSNPQGCFLPNPATPTRTNKKTPEQGGLFIWRRRWDLNPRSPYGDSTLAGWCTRPNYATSPSNPSMIQTKPAAGKLVRGGRLSHQVHHRGVGPNLAVGVEHQDGEPSDASRQIQRVHPAADDGGRPHVAGHNIR